MGCGSFFARASLARTPWPPIWLGSAAATTSVFIDLGLGGGPMLTGFLAAAWSVPTAFLWVAVLPLVGSLLLTLGTRAPGVAPR